MRYVALATDYDGTLASQGRVDGETIDALKRLAASGRKSILVTGRRLEDLERVFPEVTIFDLVVAENGPVLSRPRSGEIRLLAQPPAPTFVDALRRRGVDPLAIGHVVVATVQPNDTLVAEVIAELGLDLQVILNKGSVMVLPRSVDKATGLAQALNEMSLSPETVVGVGDAENDITFLSMCGRGIAVANALDAVKQRADYVTQGRSSAGVREIINQLVTDDLQSLDAVARARA
ncbi:MAG: HAD family phosphatase [Chloroflexi bacterium]|nr:MAG: HAD family phosphatase [Chloroflexota bacterium]